MKEAEEKQEVTLARIDENVKFLKAGAESVRIQLNEHEKQDFIKFDNINKTIWKASGIVVGGSAVVIFFVNLIFKH